MEGLLLLNVIVLIHSKLIEPPDDLLLPIAKHELYCLKLLSLEFTAKVSVLEDLSLDVWELFEHLLEGVLLKSDRV